MQTSRVGLMRPALRSAKVFVGGQAILTASAVAMVAVRTARPWSGRRISQQTVGAWAGRAILRLNGVDVRVVRDGPWSDGPCFFMANHSSSLDLPVLMSLGLPNARTFIKERFRWYGALGVVLHMTGTFFTAPQDQHKRRVQRFKDATDTLRRTGESVFGSPEGTRVEGGELGAFNKGIFHIVTALKLPIVPLFIDIPASVDPGRGIAAHPGTVTVYVGRPLDTSAWTLAALDANTQTVRDHFVAWTAEIRA